MRLLLVLAAVFLLSNCGGRGTFEAAPSHAATAKTVYRTTWTSGAAGWQTGGTGSWIPGGNVLRAKASSARGGSTFIAPYTIRTGTYSVSARMRLVDWTGALTNEYGIVIGSNGPHAPADPATAGLVGGVLQLALDLGSEAALYTLAGDSQRIYPQIADVTPPNAWHTITVEVHGATVTLLVDGSEATQATSKQAVAGSKVGLFVSGAEIQVKTFTVVSP